MNDKNNKERYKVGEKLKKERKAREMLQTHKAALEKVLIILIIVYSL